MPLTVRSNGSSSPNIITAQWFNDYYNLLTGSMQDQEVSVKNNLVLSAIGAGPSTALSAAVVSGTGLGIGAYVYTYTYVSPDGESAPATQTSVATTSGNQKVNLSAISVGPTGTTARKVYRTIVGGFLNQLLTTINDNTTTTFTDTTPDGSLGAALAYTQYNASAPPNGFQSSFGGSLILKNSAGTVTTKLYNDGSAMFSGPLIVAQPIFTINGITSGSAYCFMDEQGSVKRVLIVLVGYYNSSGSAQQFQLPTPFLQGGWIYAGGTNTAIACWQGGAVQNIATITSSGVGTAGTGIGPYGFGEVTSGFDRVLLPKSMGSAAGKGFIQIVGY